MRTLFSNRAGQYAGALIVAGALSVGAFNVASAQPADPNYQAQQQDYQQKQQDYQAAQQEYNAKQAAHADAQAAYADKRAAYHEQRADYAAQKRDYEHARADYDLRYGPGAFDAYTKTVTTTTYPAGDGSVTTVRKEVIEH